MPRKFSFSRPLLSVLLSAVPSFPCLAQTTTGITGAQGLAVTVGGDGSYSVTVANPAWQFAGNVGYALSNVLVATGSDGAGPYQEIGFDFLSDAPRHAAIRAYSNQMAVLFTQSNMAAAPNSFNFPTLRAFPAALNHVAYQGQFAVATFGALPNQSPWVFFDASGNTFILSPATHFMVAATGMNGANIASGISSQIATVPQGFTHSVLLVIDSGINRAFDTWGHTLTALTGKTRPANDADVILNQLGYWTDYGAVYYYATKGKMSYPDTLAAVRDGFTAAGIPMGYLQLDSWFYPKGPNAEWRDSADGIYQYDAAPALFPGGLANFGASIGVPLMTHSRWIDPSSPYRQQYLMSDGVSIDPQFWSTVASNLAAAGVVAYEQDWLSAQSQTAFDLSDPDSFLGDMSAAMAKQGLNMQYCMPLPQHFLQGAKYSNLTTMRASNDRFEQPRWRNFLYASRLASAVGAWPFTDNFLSSETENLLLATLSAGPVGIADPIGGLNTANLLRAVRADGVIVKPDVPLAPVDATFQNDAQEVDAPLLAATSTDFGGIKAYYLFAFPQGQNTQVTFRVADLGWNGQAYVYNYFGGSGWLVGAGDTVSVPITGTSLYLVVTPVGPSGMAVLGDTSQFVTLGKKRVSSLHDSGFIEMSLAFAGNETVRTVQVYAPIEPRVRIVSGSLVSYNYDPATQQLTLAVGPDSAGSASFQIHRHIAHSGGKSPNR